MAAATVMWTRAVTLGTDEAPRKTAALYAKDATLWGTVSDAIRDTPDLIYKYFVSGAAIEWLLLLSLLCLPVFGVEAVLREAIVRRILFHVDENRLFPRGRVSARKVAASMPRMFFFSVNS